jgi:hypothetical protein
MTDKKVSELDAIVVVDDADFMPIVDDSETTGKNKKVTVSQLKSHINSGSSGGGLTYLADHPTTSNATLVSGHLLPATNSTFDLGSAEKKIRHLYLSNNSIYMGPTDVVDSGSMAKISSVLAGDGVTRKLSMSGVDLSSDVVVDDAAKGIVLKSPNNHYWRLTVDDAGNLMAEDVGLEKP